MKVKLVTSGKPVQVLPDLRGELLPAPSKSSTKSSQPVPPVDVGLIHNVLFKKQSSPRARPVTFRVKI